MIDYFPEARRETMTGQSIHFDPEFRTFTYGDPTTPKASLQRLSEGSLLVFYAGLKGWDFPSRSALYIIGYLGGEKVLRKRMSEERFLRIHQSFEQHEFWALMFPGMLPPPMPFKIFVLGAAVFEMKFRDFLAAIFAGRFVRFSVLALLTLWFGPRIVELMGTVFRRHIYWVLGAAVVGFVVWLMMRQGRKSDLSA